VRALPARPSETTGRSTRSAPERQLSVTLYTAVGCHLCERALQVVEEVRAERDFELRVVEIDGDPELEARYREWLPVVEIDGVREFVYYVQPEGFRRKVRRGR
jgi:glutaredoxin